MTAHNQAILPGGRTIDVTDVPRVTPQAMTRVFDHLLEAGQGLALIKGLTPDQLGKLEDALWQSWSTDPQTRLAVSLRFRAILNVFAAQRLRNLVLMRGYRAVRAAAVVAANERLNVQFGFRVQSILQTIEKETAPVTPPITKQTQIWGRPAIAA